ncbi:hypothetical protein A3A95_00830 [Candidatus Nomurabacteria bacterium RIFCSPLOWO2_01_FULL_39_18]|uniref:DUF6922 domain-containing protein n=1 Tax=Candidatus Nomurabacteria bacterium RIFCSPHIGHO2_01_FULL_40_24b TaxID=1801739 RepID=A0A1F6V7D1_9BACT|nr:MAG: hypothetical protein A2647_02630 [Candidatus Nomurabacteria bacterium RIFCSPHIGHO2_01_FULL_40_24b]OGI89856.1 MAG: hypothetical protein A3A95_00830 [Candidatus Nomurabacteria bacterium RIFCSPLOWO2_01_FULL_39_18]
MKKLPEIFRSILWSYDFEKCDPIKMKNTIIANTILYGNLEHWRWIKSFYGVPEIQKILNSVSVVVIRPSVLKLANLMF